jgi:hypothetical protein
MCLSRNLSIVHANPSETPRRNRWSAAATFLLALSVMGTAAQSKDLSSKQFADNRFATSTLPDAVRAGISASIGRDQPIYSAKPQPGGFRIENPGKGVAAGFSETGVRFTAGKSVLGMELIGYGGDHMVHASQPVLSALANRVEYHRSGITEWYVNGPFGVEQGFTITSAPGVGGNKPLTVELALSGDLNPTVDEGARGLTLKRNGAAVLRYGGLVAMDARGHELSAWMDVSGKDLRLHVDTAGAQYPVTIDPFTQAVELSSAIPCDYGGVCDDGGAYHLLGNSVSVSGNGTIVVVGAPGDVYTQSPGTAYVFVEPRLSGWSCILNFSCDFTAKLYASDGQRYERFGNSVAISSDGTTIAVGKPSSVSAGTAGATYVFVEPSTGWSGRNGLSETAKLTATDGTYPGESVAISSDGSTIAAGDLDGGSVGAFLGSVYVYARPANGWTSSTQTAELSASDSQTYNTLGVSIGISADGNTIVAEGLCESECIFATGNGGTGTYLFLKPANGWADSHETVKLSQLAGAVGISNDGSAIVVGGGTYGSGASVFVKPAGGWTSMSPTATLTASDKAFVGASVSISGDGNTIVATHYDPYGEGAVYAYLKPTNGWTNATEDTKFTSNDGVSGDAFGFSTALSSNGGVLLVGAPQKQVGNNVWEGVAYVFTGSAATPRASASPSSLAFGNQTTGTTSNTQSATLTNTGSAPLHISSVAASGPFTTTQNCVAASPLAPGANCSENVAFAPTSVGNLAGTLTFTDDSGGTAGAMQTVSLSGTGVQASTSTSISSVSPNPVLVGQPVTVTYSVTPQAANSLTPSGTVTVTANTGENCTGPAPSGSCTLTFASAVNRSITATYNGDSNFTSSTSSSVPERVVDFALSANPTSQTISGKKAMYTLTVTSVNGFAGTVTVGCSGGPAGTACAINPTSVTLGASANATATLTLPKTVASGTYTVTFTGTYGVVTRTITATLTVK